MLYQISASLFTSKGGRRWEKRWSKRVREKNHVSKTPPLTSLLFSSRTWSYSLSEAKKMSDVTFSKQWIHFLLSDFWPPTSTILCQSGHVCYGCKRGNRSKTIFYCCLATYSLAILDYRLNLKHLPISYTMCNHPNNANAFVEKLTIFYQAKAFPLLANSSTQS